ncbi:MAG: hypothetical protein Greene071421_344 [Parcubacteria group bacterium Greene0714_21]|nr:MAG: hypothetical protein Greene041639_162 [Parcubacteria group bacterium Greene0416_39]TSC98027.1 MAG: hypothetical protein Greene101447_190 [Parcubacteria group bacterium Greene1014_47]TSD04182.1 MAG: hypothetical protein Greene071421_344 [Parcubacteria group bacterium Greene0714_21]
MFLEGRPYHILNKAVDQRPIFGLKEDCNRFIFQMYAANIGSPAPNLQRLNIGEAAQKILRGEKLSDKFLIKSHDPLVEFFSFVLAKDHYHFGLVPLAGNGISRYMQKLNLAYAKYFNKKHERQGPLFETRFRAKAITTPAQLNALVKMINIQNILEIAEDPSVYFYSSFPDVFSKRKSLFILPATLSELKKNLGEDFFKSISLKSDLQQVRK